MLWDKAAFRGRFGPPAAEAAAARSRACQWIWASLCHEFIHHNIKLKYISGFKIKSSSGIIGFRDGIGHGLVWGIGVRDLRLKD